MTLQYGGLLAVAVIALLSPLLVRLAPRLRIPSVVVEIVAGIIIGPSVLDWVHVDTPLTVLSLIGLAFLLFLAGLEIDLMRIRGPLLTLSGGGFIVSLALAAAVGFGLHGVGYAKSGLLVGIALTATSLGLVVPVLKDAGQVDGELGQLSVASASVADFGGIVLLSLFFGESQGGAGSKILLLGGLVVLVIVTALVLSRVGRSMKVDQLLTSLQDTTAEIRVRIAVLMLMSFVYVAGKIGLETILGAFLAGAILGLVDRDGTSHPNFRLKLEAIGYGFVVPVFFVTSGLKFDLHALLHSPSAWVRVPVFVAALLVVRGVPAVLYVRRIGRRQALAAALLQATSLPFLVTVVQIGLTLKLIVPTTGAALVTAGLISVLLLPPLALALLQRDAAAEETVRPDDTSVATPVPSAGPA